jgi:hypothetical protein
VAGFTVFATTGAGTAEEFRSPDIVVLGDSQLSFGSGPVFLDFFQNIESHCQPDARQARDLEQLGDKSVAVIGVRSTSLRSWVARKGRAKGRVCDVDKKWRVNAGTFGSVNTTKNKYVQIGQGKQYQFCKHGQSPFEAMFADEYYKPKLLIMSFLGNSAKRWATDKEAAFKDVADTMAQLPEGMPCIFMTSAPSYHKKTVDLRLKAQQNIKAAFKQSGSRCSFVEGFTPETIAANQGNKLYFRRNSSGKVKDPFHPNEKAAKNFFMVRTNDICEAVYGQLAPQSTKTAFLPPQP